MSAFYGIDLNQKSGLAATGSEILSVLEQMRPCPSPYPMVRVGGNRDGAYLLPDDLQGIAACFSPGVSNRKLFEDELATRYSIPSHLCDYSSAAKHLSTSLIEDMQTFERKWLDIAGTDNSVRLEDWVNQYHEPNAGDLLLQMDIEGAEYRNLLDTPIETLARFRIVVVELHGLHKLRDAGVLKQVFEPFLAHLGRMFTCIHAHPNNCCGQWKVPHSDVHVPRVMELTLIRNDRLAGTRTGACFPVMIPHPLDIVNVKRRDPLFLDEYWFPGERPEVSCKTMWKQQLARAEALLQELEA